MREKTPKPLTRRQLLSQVASLYDLGLTTPVKQKGGILFQRAFQEARRKTQDTWDTPLSEKLREEAIHLFKEYTCLNQITFHRSLTPVGLENPGEKPSQMEVTRAMEPLHTSGGRPNKPSWCGLWSPKQSSHRLTKRENQ